MFKFIVDDNWTVSENLVFIIFNNDKYTWISWFGKFCFYKPVQELISFFNPKAQSHIQTFDKHYTCWKVDNICMQLYFMHLTKQIDLKQLNLIACVQNSNRLRTTIIGWWIFPFQPTKAGEDGVENNVITVSGWACPAVSSALHKPRNV